MAAKIIRSIYNIRPAQRGGVLTIGHFDGVHIGHQRLIEMTKTRAKDLGVSSAAMTFEPHAFEYFQGDKVTVPRLTRMREKLIQLSACDLGSVIIIPFNQQVAELNPSDFVMKMVYEPLRPRHIVVGDDFHFGKERAGNAALLEAMGQTLGFTVETLPTVMLDNERISSTQVRKSLAVGDLALAKRLLGRPYSMQGRVRHGDQRGRQIGFPTANIFLQRKLTPVKGVYVVYMRGLDVGNPAAVWPGVANVGQRPTFDGTRTLLEVHLLDFHQDIYGRHVEVEFVAKIRDEEKFSSFDALKEQIAKDVRYARDYFNKPGV